MVTDKKLQMQCFPMKLVKELIRMPKNMALKQVRNFILPLNSTTLFNIYL